MRKMVNLAATSLASVLFLVASVVAIQPMCPFLIHEPDIPEALK